MLRMRTIEQATLWVKKTDPETALTKWALRNLVLSGEIPHKQIGTKRLVALEDIEAYVDGQDKGKANK